jgi:hypothetical protein
MATTKITQAEWLAAVKDAEAAARPLTTDPGVLTAVEFAKMIGTSLNPALQRLLLLVEHGLAEVTKKVVLDTMGRRVNVRAYRLLTKQAKPGPGGAKKNRVRP